jgi:hypothetical protein
MGVLVHDQLGGLLLGGLATREVRNPDLFDGHNVFSSIRVGKHRKSTGQSLP